MLDDVDHTGQTDHPHTTPTRQETLENVQAHLLRASKFKIGSEHVVPKNWSLFFFFRILTQAEFGATMQRMKSVANIREPSRVAWDGNSSKFRISYSPSAAYGESQAEKN